MRAPTPGQTVGPFFGYALPFAGGEQLVPPSHPAAIQLTGRVLDALGEPVPDALIEVWQSDGDGRAASVPGTLARDPFGFTGFGRAATDGAGRYRFSTLCPGTGFFSLAVFARGLNHRLFTRAYLSEAPDDDLLTGLPAPRRATLRIHQTGRRLDFDVHLGGPLETVFLAFPGQLP